MELVADWEVLPSSMNQSLASAPGVIVLDPLSFPWDSLGSDALTAPFWLLLEAARPESKELNELLGEQMLARMTFFDRFVTDSDEIGEILTTQYGFAQAQLTVASSIDPVEIVEEALAELSPPDPSDLEDHYEPTTYWVTRGELLSRRHPAQAIGSLHHGLRDNKILHLTQAGALKPILVGSRSDREWAIAEVGCGVGRWAVGLPPHVRYSGFDVSQAMIDVARESFPRHHFEKVEGESVPLPAETQDVVFTCTVLHHNPPPRRRRMIQSMFKALKVGGTLAFIEDFVARQSEDGTETVYPMSIGQFMDDVIEATGGNVVLRHVESLQYPYDAFRRGGLVAVTKIGRPGHL